MVRLIVSWIFKILWFPFRVLGWAIRSLIDALKHEKNIYDDSKKYGYSRKFVRAFKAEQQRKGPDSLYDDYTLDDLYRDMKDRGGGYYDPEDY